jgi:hypothetical protein
MMRLGSLVVAVAVGVGVPAVATGQDAPRRLVAPVRGEAAVEITAPDTKVMGNEVVTTIRVKNVSSGPIAGLKIDENWYKGSDPVGGDTYRHPRPLPVGEVILVTLRSPRARIIGARNQYQFSHANGTVKPTAVKSLELPKPTK